MNTAIKDYSTDLACALNGYRALIVPDLHNNQLPHWQSLWEQTIPRTSRIRMLDWHTADWVKWRNSIIASIIAIDEPVVLIDEGLGALAAASVAAEYPGKVIAAFLVNPADPDRFDIRKKIPKQLPITTTIVVSGKLTDEANSYLAVQWDTDFLQASNLEAGTANAFINYWAEGIQELNRLVSKVQRNFKEASKVRARRMPNAYGPNRQALSLNYM